MWWPALKLIGNAAGPFFSPAVALQADGFHVFSYVYITVVSLQVHKSPDGPGSAQHCEQAGLLVLFVLLSALLRMYADITTITTITHHLLGLMLSLYLLLIC